MAWARITFVERVRLIHEMAGPDYSTLLNLKGKGCTAKIVRFRRLSRSPDEFVQIKH